MGAYFEEDYWTLNCDRPRTIDYRSIPAAAFTHPEISYVGLTEPQARELAEEEGFRVETVKTYFKGNSKALAEGETDGMAKIVYRQDTGEVLDEAYKRAEGPN